MIMFYQIILFRPAKMGPRQHFAGRIGPLSTGIQIHAVVSKGLLPYGNIETLIPQIEFRPCPPGGFNHRTQPAVAAGQR